MQRAHFVVDYGTIQYLQTRPSAMARMGGYNILAHSVRGELRADARKLNRALQPGQTRACFYFEIHV